MSELQALGDDLKRKAGAQEALRAEAEEAGRSAEAYRQQAARLDEVVALLAALQEVWRENFQQAVGRLVSQGLTGVFDEPLDLQVELGVAGDLPVARFALKDSRGLETEVVEARGGGIVNVASFLLRVLLLMSSRPAQARLLVLDETFGNVSEEYLPALRALLRRICEEGGFQMVLVTHRQGLAEAGDTVYEFSQQDGLTRVRLAKRPEDEAAQG